MRFVQGLDYGPRKGTLGFVVHMAEGGDGTVGYLSRRPGESWSAWRDRVRGVSAHFVILSSGEVVQMVDWDHSAGSMNPSARSDSSGFYQEKYIKLALGDHYVDPNAWSLSVEITGYRAVGPNPSQIKSLYGLVAEARKRYPSLVGVYGHADQTATKGCPGISAAMLAFWKSVGHGAFPPLPDSSTEEPMRNFEFVYGPDGRLVTGTLTVKSPDGVSTPHYYLRLHDGKLVKASGIVGKTKQAVKVRLTEDITSTPVPGVDRRTGYLVGDIAAFLLQQDVDFKAYPVVPMSDVNAKIAEAVRPLETEVIRLADLIDEATGVLGQA